MKNFLIFFLFIALSFTSCVQKEPVSKKQQFIDSLLNEMTLEEKISQMNLLTSDWSMDISVMKDSYLEMIREGRCGSVFHAHTVEFNRKFQETAVKETRLGIPLLFGYDIIHGYKTIFPIPLAESASWEPELAKKTARLASREAAAGGITWTFNPMVDISTDPRWGRIAEASGEDAFLGSVFARAKVEGHQGEDLSDPFTLAACVKHFAAYGEPVAGKDYNTVDMSLRKFKEDYLPPYRAAVEADVASVMTGFNELFGVPVTGSKFLLKDLLRNELEFNGMIVSDYKSVEEMVEHGYARNKRHSGELAALAGVDMDMQDDVYYDYLAESVREGTISEDLIDESVRNILGLKYDLGLFEDPYRYLDQEREDSIIYHEELMEHALVSARKSIVLLENKPFKGEKLLPVKKEVKEIALIGPLATAKESMMGCWKAAGDDSKVVSVLEGLKTEFSNSTIHFSKGCEIEEMDRSGFDKAVNLAKSSDLVIMALGEHWLQSGEASSRARIGLPGVQEELVRKIKETGKPIVVVLMAGRPLAVPWIAENIPAVVNAWHLGTRAGDAIADVLSGVYNPSGKLTVTFPRDEGQIPIYYSHKNTGRPFKPDDKYTTKYLDMPVEPLYPFGYGLSYTEFNYSNLTLDKKQIKPDEVLAISVKVKNTGGYEGEEIVQLYTRDIVGSVTRPVKELKAFRKIKLKPGEEKVVDFQISSDDLKFYDIDMNFVAEPGDFKVFVGKSSREVLEAEFSLVK